MKLSQHIKENLNLSFPIMISQLGHITVGVADSLMIGNVSIPQLAAVSLSTSITYTFLIRLIHGETRLGVKLSWEAVEWTMKVLPMTIETHPIQCFTSQWMQQMVRTNLVSENKLPPWL